MPLPLLSNDGDSASKRWAGATHFKKPRRNGAGASVRLRCAGARTKVQRRAHLSAPTITDLNCNLKLHCVISLQYKSQSGICSKNYLRLRDLIENIFYINKAYLALKSKTKYLMDRKHLSKLHTKNM